MATRLYPDRRVLDISPNQSSRTSRIRGIVAHATQGANVPGVADLVGLGHWFGQTSSQVSAHGAVDGDGTSGRYVQDGRKAWHCAAFNSQTLGLEQIGFAEQKSWSQAELDEAARWFAMWSLRHGIPLRRGAVSGSSVTRPGILTHEQLGAAGGGHHDPGPAYPLDKVIARARVFRAAMVKQRKAA